MRTPCAATVMKRSRMPVLLSRICSAAETRPRLLLSIALVHARHGAEDRAASLLGYVDREFGRAGRIFFPMLMRIRDEIVSRAQAALGPADFDRQTAAGAALTEEQALSLAFDEVVA